MFHLEESGDVGSLRDSTRIRHVILIIVNSTYDLVPGGINFKLSVRHTYRYLLLKDAYQVTERIFKT